MEDKKNKHHNTNYNLSIYNTYIVVTFGDANQLRQHVRRLKYLIFLWEYN